VGLLGVRPPWRTLQPTQAQTMFSHVISRLAARHDVVEAQLRGRMLLAAILALVLSRAKILRRLTSPSLGQLFVAQRRMTRGT